MEHINKKFDAIIIGGGPSGCSCAYELTKSGKRVNCKKMILTTGTFLNGLIHIGEEKTPAGRFNEKPSTTFS